VSRTATACAVVLDGDGRVLLQQRSDNQRWALPGGHVERGETVTEAVVREVEEETGCHVRPIRLAGVYSAPEETTHRYPSGDVSYYVAVCFLCELVDGETRPDGNESTAVSWLTPDKARAILWERHVVRLDDALSDREDAAAR
jgi:8-oxo-dGTP pyrophosphatase MutT (NUDIX family)